MVQAMLAGVEVAAGRKRLRVQQAELEAVVEAGVQETKYKSRSQEDEFIDSFSSQLDSVGQGILELLE